MKKILLVMGVGALLALGSGCATSNTQKEASGARLWAQNCIRCHNSRSPASYSEAQWEVAMLHMRVRGNLTPQEHKQILEFLQSQ